MDLSCFTKLPFKGPISHNCESVLALHQPDLYPKFFDNPASLSAWISSLFTETSCSNHTFCTHFHKGIFYIYNLQQRSCLSVTPFQVSSSHFHPLKLFDSFTLFPSCQIHPPWFYFDENHYLASLQKLLVTDLVETLSSLHVPYRGAKKHDLVHLVLHQFLIHRHQISLKEPTLDPSHPLIFYYEYFLSKFGQTTLTAFMVPQNFVTPLTSSRVQKELLDSLLEISNGNECPIKSKSSLFSKKILKAVLSKLPHHPVFKNTHASMSDALITSFRQRCHHLSLCTVLQIIDYIHCWDPISTLPTSWNLKDLIHHLLTIEYSQTITDHLLYSSEERRRKQQSDLYAVHRLEKVDHDLKFERDIVDNWPTVPSSDTIYDCLRQYRLKSQWSPGQICAACSRSRYGVPMLKYSLGNVTQVIDDLNLHLLENIKLHKSPFFSKLPIAFDNILLDSRGITGVEPFQDLHLCSDCDSSLKKNEIPRFALANNLFRGSFLINSRI